MLGSRLTTFLGNGASEERRCLGFGLLSSRFLTPVRRWAVVLIWQVCSTVVLPMGWDIVCSLFVPHLAVTFVLVSVSVIFLGFELHFPLGVLSLIGLQEPLHVV